MKTPRKRKIFYVLVSACVLVVFFSFKYLGEEKVGFEYLPPVVAEIIGLELVKIQEPPKPIVTHIKTPKPLKGIYMTACYAATPSLRIKLTKLIEDTELNSVVIDIKDYSGTISFNSENLLLENDYAKGCVVADMQEFVASLHEKGIYVIGRITVFQDPYQTKKYLELAVKKDSDRTVVWKDHKGLSFIDVGAKDYWNYIVALSKESYEIGFDELNFDYVRFPSDGNMKDIYYPFSGEKIANNPEFGRAEVLRDFFSYLNKQMKVTGAVLSVDLFGMVTTNTDDLGIGQILEYAEQYFDYIMPMVYPSHYPSGFNGWKNVNSVPYEVVNFAMNGAVERLISASSTSAKLRPWLQDFDYPVLYTTDMVRAQIRATYDAGLTSWVLWDPANRYTSEALQIEI